MDKNTADKIIKLNWENYDSFAESFSQTRNYLPEAVKSLFAGRVKAGDRVLDIGCGNGRFYPFFKEIGAVYTGVDNSKNLVAIAKDNYPEADFRIGEALDLPFENEKFDLIASMAVLHHIPSKACRENFFKEARRVLKPDGIFVVTVWDIRPWTLVKSKQWKRLADFWKTQVDINLGFEKLDPGDFYIPWQNKYRRYHHVFFLLELKGMAKKTAFKIDYSGILKIGERQSNLYIIARKA